MAVTLDRLFKEPRRTERPLRILVYGLPKRGKSHFVFTGARVGPLYWIDTEGGSDYYSPTEGHGFRVLRSTDPRHAIQAVEAASASVNGGVRPVVAVDSFSSVWFSQQEVAEELTRQWSRGRGGDRASFRAWGPAKKPLKQLYNLMMATRCHVIVTARAKEKYEVSRDGEPVAKGIVPDVERNLAYAVDLIVELGVEELPKGKQPSPDDYTALVVGSRSPAIQIGTLFQNPSLGLFLPATAEGEAPEDVVSTVDVQVHNALVAPSTWRELRAILESKGWDIDKAKELWQKFGPFNAAQVVEYWEYLMVHQEPHAAS
jgi:hypothetical protein